MRAHARAAFSMVVLPFVCVKECFGGCCAMKAPAAGRHEASWHKASVSGMIRRLAVPIVEHPSAQLTTTSARRTAGAARFGRSTTLPPRDYCRGTRRQRSQVLIVRRHHPPPDQLGRARPRPRIRRRRPPTTMAAAAWGSSASEEPCGRRRRASCAECRGATIPSPIGRQTARSSYGRSPFGMYCERSTALCLPLYPISADRSTSRRAL